MLRKSRLTLDLWISLKARDSAVKLLVVLIGIVLYIHETVHRNKFILYKELTRCNFGSTVY